MVVIVGEGMIWREIVMERSAMAKAESQKKVVLLIVMV